MEMSWSERQINVTALIVSVAVHILILLIQIPERAPKIVIQEMVKVPVKLQVIEIQPQIHVQKSVEATEIPIKSFASKKSQQQLGIEKLKKVIATTPVTPENPVIKPSPLQSGKVEMQPSPIAVPVNIPNQVKAQQIEVPKSEGQIKAPEEPSFLPGDRDAPEVIYSIEPIYPKKAQNAEITGRVEVEVTVSAEGDPIHFEVLRSSGHDILDKSFINALLKQKFKPRRVKGRDVEGKIRCEHVFKID